MIKKILFGMILFFSITACVYTLDLSLTEKAFNKALSSTPSSYEYIEESGALIFILKKNYKYDVISNGSGAKQLVTYSSTQNQRPTEEDPRPPIKEGDLSEFSMKQLLCEADIFAESSGLTDTPGRTKTVSGTRYRVVEVSYSYTDDAGRLWPMVGELLIHGTSGIPFQLVAEQQYFPDDIYSLSIEVDFSGAYSSTCRITECRTYQTGQHGIFRYKYDTVRSFVY